MIDNIDEQGYGICAVCGKYELIKMRSNGKNIGWYCTQRPADEVIQKLEIKKKDQKYCKSCGIKISDLKYKINECLCKECVKDE